MKNDNYIFNEQGKLRTLYPHSKGFHVFRLRLLRQASECATHRQKTLKNCRVKPFLMPKFVFFGCSIDITIFYIYNRCIRKEKSNVAEG